MIEKVSHIEFRRSVLSWRHGLLEITIALSGRKLVIVRSLFGARMETSYDLDDIDARAVIQSNFVENITQLVRRGLFWGAVGLVVFFSEYRQSLPLAPYLAAVASIAYLNVGINRARMGPWWPIWHVNGKLLAMVPHKRVDQEKLASFMQSVADNH